MKWRYQINTTSMVFRRDAEVYLDNQLLFYISYGSGLLYSYNICNITRVITFGSGPKFYKANISMLQVATSLVLC